MQTHRVLLDRRAYQGIRIDESMMLHVMNEAIDINYALEFSDAKQKHRIEFTSSNRVYAGDWLVKNENEKWCHVPSARFRANFERETPELKIEVDRMEKRVRGFLVKPDRPALDNEYEVIRIEKTVDNRAWIITYCESVNQYDLVSALDMMQVIDASIRKVKEIDPRDWFRL